MSSNSPCHLMDSEELDEDPVSELDLSTGNKETFVFEIDDAEDAEVVSVLLDPPVPEGFHVVNTETVPGLPNIVCNLQTFTRVWRGQLSVTNNKAFSNVFDHLLRGLFFKLRRLVPCAICHIDFDIDLPEADEIQVSITGVCTGIGEPASSTNGLMDIAPAAKSDPLKPNLSMTNTGEHDLMFPMEMMAGAVAVAADYAAGTNSGASSLMTSPSRSVLGTPVLNTKTAPRHSRGDKKPKYHQRVNCRQGIELTPLQYIPGATIHSYLGHLNFFLIRESTSVRMEGGLNGFMQAFLAEVMAICRAHVLSLGGNALVSFQLSECVLDDNLHKNQSQCLVNVYGDVVQVLYEMDLQQPLSSSGGALKLGGISPLLAESGKTTKKITPKSTPSQSPRHSKAVNS